ncbi:MAG TPA: ABC transporter substrate-binding protein [Methylomirabilota bacterium]|jgi:phospholipid transport system substrate-binding protein|nr:ABC transporter substrate-binding protein [Methylomirabilota bacterium]
MLRVIGLGVISIVLAFSHPVRAEGPGEQLQDAISQVMLVLQDPERTRGKLDESRDHIRRIVNGIFDWGETSRQVLARHWEPLTPLERDEFTALFADVVLRSHLALIQAHPAQEIAMVLLGETVDGERAAGGAKLVSKSSVVPIAYRCIKHERDWKVYDVAVDGVSILSSSRSQIGRLIERFGYGGMIMLLRAKQSQLVAEQSGRSTRIGRIDPN